MTEVDKKNNEILLDIYSKLSLKSESLNWVKGWFNSPDIDPIYAKELGPDLRKRWNISYKDLISNGMIRDEAYALFIEYFAYYKSYAPGQGYPLISSFDFNENKVVWKGNPVKLKKILSDFYKKNIEYAVAQWYRNGDSIGLGNIPRVSLEKEPELFDQYIIKANEAIGTKKISNEKNVMELVMSCNPADWFMCSTAEKWSSCLSMESTHGYWIGIPFMLDDKNRTMFYISSNGRKKNHLGIEVDGFNSRSWGLLDKDDIVHTVRWFPDSVLNNQSIESITGLSIKGNNLFDKSKYCILSKIKFEDGVSHTPYLDRIGIEEKIIGENTSIFYSGNGETGFRRLGGSRSHINAEGVEKFIKSGKEYFRFLYYKSCQFCNKEFSVLDGRIGIFKFNNDYCCGNCKSEKIFSCGCGSDRLKSEGFLYKGTLYCKSCFTTKFGKCSVCGKVELKKDIKLGLCTDCFSNPSIVTECDGCGEKILIKKGIKLFSKRVGDRIFCGEECSNEYQKSSNRMWGVVYKKCVECKSSYDEEDMYANFNGTFICGKDCFTFYDKKQYKFKFITKSTK